MANETILIVDPDAPSLRLAAAVLRREGYRVQLSSSSEQALMILQIDTVDLLLVSTDQPGLSAASLVSTLKQDPRTANLIAIALLPRNSRQREDASPQKVFAGTLTKPLDPLELARSVRDLLRTRPASESSADAAPELPAAIAFRGPEAEYMKRAFVAEGSRQTRNFVNSLGPAFDASQAHQAIHEWSRTAQALGFGEISQLAGAAAQVLKPYSGDQTRLYIALTNLLDAFLAAAEAGGEQMPEAVARKLRGRPVALIGFSHREAERLCEALARAGAMGRLFDAGEPLDSETVAACALIVVHVRLETYGMPCLAPAPPNSLPRPLVLVGKTRDLLGLDPAVHDRSSEFLIDGWQPEEAVLRLGRAISRAPAEMEFGQPPAPAAPAEPERRKSGEVLIVDDDPSVRILVQTVLENHGIKCRVASNAAEGIAMSRTYQPSAALLDVNMPDMSGFEALPKIRAESPGVRVVMLTGREQEADIVQGFALGSDDYVVKPFIPKELVARVKRLL